MSDLERSLVKFHERVTVMVNAAGHSLDTFVVACGHGIGHLCRTVAALFELLATTADHMSRRFEQRHSRKQQNNLLEYLREAR